MKAFTRVYKKRLYDYYKMQYRYIPVREYIITTEEHIKILNRGKRRIFTEAPGTLYDWYERIREHTGDYYPAVRYVYQWEEENENI